MTTVRWILGLPVAGAITAILFIAMAALIKNDEVIVDPANTPGFKILANIKDTPEGGEEKQARPVLKKKPPDPVIHHAEPTGKPNPTQTTIDKTTVTTETFKGEKMVITPTIITPPPYPQACASKGVEGVVVVQFDVTPEGRVVNVRIIDSPDACFHRTVRNTVAKWKYPPAMENGRPVMRRGVIERIAFKLED